MAATNVNMKIDNGEEQFLKQLIGMNYVDIFDGKCENIPSCMFTPLPSGPPSRYPRGLFDQTDDHQSRAFNTPDLIGYVNHYRLCDILKFINSRYRNSIERNLSFGRNLYEGVIEKDGMKAPVVIKFWFFRVPPFPPPNNYKLYPAKLANEIYLLNKEPIISSPNFPKLIGYTIDRCLAVVYELLPTHSLSRVIYDYDIMNTWKDRMLAAIGVAKAIQTLHSGGYGVGDIDPSNIFFDEQLNAKLCQFSLCNFVISELDGKVAPEIILKDVCTVDQEGDVFSFGALLVDLISKERVGDDEYDSIPQIVEELPSDAPLVVRDSFDVDAKTLGNISKLVRSCLDYDSKKRPKIDFVIECLEKFAKGPELSREPNAKPDSPRMSKKSKLVT